MTTKPRADVPALPHHMTHGARSESLVRYVGTVQKRRLLRQIGLRTSDLDGVGIAYLDAWARAQSKVELMDAWSAEHGWLTPEGVPPPFVLVYFAAVNSARLAIDRFAAHLRQQKPRVVIDLSRYAARPRELPSE
jgi:hypothetical protein